MRTPYLLIASIALCLGACTSAPPTTTGGSHPHLLTSGDPTPTGACAAACGNGFCEAGEDAAHCPRDCH